MKKPKKIKTVCTDCVIEGKVKRPKEPASDITCPDHKETGWIARLTREYIKKL